ncbi:uncharacterized protein PITG_06723 [Phytophthora infestans T30-4]|uniref:Oxidoreductase n=1 Tax=Phytophthora infestans (strain T30-4) TaxID=403677 RepID=D0N7Y3_PHYIT|nr:uncharacterized protein PITG_06723 [Phytophthora infestans T30-4]EEY53100.1 conserved hypothetical protein [Phytophthora infestans T30-4]|eukprot:XP_002904718.1 conserved hypothetical protein [Phytophthora infestans T30-4]
MAKHALVVGASSGIGLAVALKMAPMVDKLTLCSRRCPPDLVASIRAKYPGLDVVYERLDVSLLHEVRRFTARHKDTKFDWIVLTAGILSLNGRTETKEGLDVKMSTHYYGRFMLVHDLLAGLDRPGVRVLNVLGAGRGGAPHLNDLDLKANYSIKHCADATTLYSDLMAQALSEHAPNASFMHIYPGFVNTGLFNRFPWYVRVPSKVFAVVAAHSPERCAEYLVATLTKPEFATGWKLLGERGEPLSKTKYHTDKLKNTVWDHTLKTIETVMKPVK